THKAAPSRQPKRKSDYIPAKRECDALQDAPQGVLQNDCSDIMKSQAQVPRVPHPVYGAGDGNRTHVRSLGSFYTAIVRRPLVLLRLRAQLYITAQTLVQVTLHIRRLSVSFLALA